MNVAAAEPLSHAVRWPPTQVLFVRKSRTLAAPSAFTRGTTQLPLPPAVEAGWRKLPRIDITVQLVDGGGVSRSGASVGRQDELAAARNEEVDLMQRRHALRCKQVGRDCPAKPETRNPKHQRRDG